MFGSAQDFEPVFEEMVQVRWSAATFLLAGINLNSL
jgi:hypothetical protein